jgi:hypothetical protein
VKKLRVALVALVVPLVLLAGALFVASPASAAKAVTVVGRINGGGTAVMTDGMGTSSFGFEATLFSDGTAQGHFDCVDHVGDAPGYPGNIFGQITGWSLNPDNTVNLFVTNGKLVSFPNGLVVPGGLPFEVTIQSSGGAGVGHWTLAVPNNSVPPVCIELLLSGQIKVSWS